jgi:hypothetical protein
MHKVIDFGALRSEQLSEFFASSNDNIAVLSDMMIIESLKQQGIQRFRNSLEILSQNDKRVLILKPSGDAARTPPNRTDFPKNLIDWNATGKFSGFCAQVRSDSQPEVLQHLDQNQQKARKFVANVGANVETLREAAASTLSNFPPDFLSALRAGRESIFHPELLRHIRASGEAIALGQFQTFFPGVPRPLASDLPYWLPFRYSIALYSLAIRWNIVGGLSALRPDKLRNDSLDMFYVACGTAFDGVMTEDSRLNAVYDLAHAALLV